MKKAESIKLNKLLKKTEENRSRSKGAGNNWALVLMGGGARGLAHIGVLEALLENDLVPPVITGTSMGAIIGGLFAAGYLPREIEEISHELSYSRLAKVRQAKLPIPGKLVDFFLLESYQRKLIRRLGEERGDVLEKSLRQLVGEVLIQNLSIRFGCNAVDLISGREVSFTQGPLYLALRASMAFPFVIEPARFSKMLLVDGGLLNNVPIELAKKLGAERVFVPDVHRPLKKVSAKSFNSTLILVHRLIQVVLADSTYSKLPQADLIVPINPKVDTFDFTRVSQVVRLGKNITEKNIQAIKSLAARDN
ncbi:MAG: patatin-like phospholipase family protein [Candidatus Aminicenantes bacterium]|nr:patatin-like phospholipase family protein [Candidatus Aminicenantes bacterium]